MSDSHRTAIVTGASRGLGLVVARVLAATGYDLVIGARDAGALEAAAASLGVEGRRVIAVPGDVAADAVRHRLIDAAHETGGLRVLVNNASMLGGLSPAAAQDPGILERLLQVNFIAPVAMMQLALPLMSASGGLVINVTSDAAQGAYPGWGGYGSSKAALDLMTRTAAAELSGSGQSPDRAIAVVGVDPGDMRTRMHQEAFPDQDISDRPLPEATAAFWRWLLDQPPGAINGRRFAAQDQEARWLARA